MVSNKEYYKRRYKILKERKKLARNRVRKLKLNPTKYENIFIGKLKKTSYYFVFQKAFFNEWYFRIVDFYFKKYNLVIEIDGKYHEEEVKKKKDQKSDLWLESLGMKVVRLTNEEAENITVSQIKKIIENGKRQRSYRKKRNKIQSEHSDEDGEDTK